MRIEERIWRRSCDKMRCSTNYYWEIKFFERLKNLREKKDENLFREWYDRPRRLNCYHVRCFFEILRSSEDREISLLPHSTQFALMFRVNYS